MMPTDPNVKGCNTKTISALYLSRVLVFSFVYLFVCAAAFVSADGKNSEQNWVATWATANIDISNPDMAALNAVNHSFTNFSNQTIRNIVHTTIGGRALRIRLSNAFGAQPITFDAVFIGTQKQGAAIVAGSNHAVTFGGANSITIPEGSEALSDEVPLATTPQQNLAISLYTTKSTGFATIHGSAFQTNHLSDPGNHAAEETAQSFTKTTGSWFFLAAVDVLAPNSAPGAIVALGDSITDGSSSTNNSYDRWTDVLARRLNPNPSKPSFGVLNAGIGGNRVLSSSPCFGQNALARLDRDVFARSAVRSIILFEGTNDIGQPDTHAEKKFVSCLARTHITANDLIAGYKQIIAQAHARHLKIFGATILPFQGFNAWTEQGESTRLSVNRWIKESQAFDGVIDFAAALADPANPARLASQFDSGDHLHPSPAGHHAMAQSINLTLVN
jgi:lysophospholipase L1-like esterase